MEIDANEVVVNKEKIAEYEQFVLRCINKFGSMSKLVRNDEIDPNELNLAMGSYLEVTQGLLTEYQKAKMVHFYAEMNYEEWYAEQFEIAKKEVIQEYEVVNDGITAKTKQVKPSLKEFEMRVKSKFRKELRAQKETLMVAHSEMRLVLRLLDTLKKYDNILTALGNNMRQEMRSLSAINRANADPEQVSRKKVRRGFPTPEEQEHNRKNLL